MPRVKGGYTTRRRRKAILKLAKGYFGSKRTLYKTAHEQVMRSLAYAYRDRKQKKREFRKLWISRINAACKANDFKYSLLISGLNKANVLVNRKVLAEIAIFDKEGFKDLIEIAKKANKGEKIASAKASGKVVEAEKTAETPKKAAPKKAEAKAETKVEAKKETKAEAPKKEAKQDLNDLTVAELKEMAKEKNIEGYSKMKKAELIDALK